MIVEFPDPANCAPRSYAPGLMQQARRAFVGLIPEPPTSSFRLLQEPVPVTVVGPLFLDKVGEWRKLAPVGSAQVFEPTGHGGKRRADGRAYVKQHSLGKALRAAVAAVNAERKDGKLPKLRWYEATRHSFASRYVQAGGSLMKLAGILGHSATRSRCATRTCSRATSRSRSAHSWTSISRRARCCPLRAGQPDVLRWCHAPAPSGVAPARKMP